MYKRQHMDFNPLCSLDGRIKQKAMTCVQTVKRPANQTKLELWNVSHRRWLSQKPLSSSQDSQTRQPSEDCAPVPNGLVHSFLRGLTLGTGACCSVRWLSRVHSCVAQGPITHRWFTAFAPEITPRRVIPVFDCGRTRGVRRHCSFHSRSA